MNTELVAFHASITAAKTCEDVFGALTGSPSTQMAFAKRMYRQFAAIVHEDKHANYPEARIVAHEAFTLLAQFWADAQGKIEAGTYGTKSTPKGNAVVASRTGSYTIREGLASGDLSTIYGGVDQKGEPVVVKMSRTPVVNDLLMREATALTTLKTAAQAAPIWLRFLPVLADSFKVKDVSRGVRQVNVFAVQCPERLVPLTDLVAHFPKGIDPRHFVWIFKRLLSVLGFAHDAGVIHGAVLPTHILVRPADHSLLLVDWAYSCEPGQRIVALSPGYRSFYAPEVLAKAPAGGYTDIYMAAKCMEYLLGGELAEGVPMPFLRFLRQCLIQNPYRRANGAFLTHGEFAKVAKEVYGPSRFVDLVLT